MKPRASWALLGPFALLAFTPVAGLVPSGVTVPLGAGTLLLWIGGVALLPIAALLVRAAAERALPEGWRGWWHGTEPLLADRRLLAALALVAAALYVAIALLVFDGRPLHIDEMTQAFQARVFGQGRLWEASPGMPEFTSTLLVVDDGTRVYSQFPPGWAALLAIGGLVGAPWLVGPLCGAASVLAVYALVRALGEERPFAFATSALFALSPWVAFNAGSQMNHTAALLWITLASAALVHALPSAGAQGEGGAPRGVLGSLLAGAAFGLAALTRPLDAVAFALPASAWAAVATARDRRRLGAALGLAFGLLFTGTILLWFNTTVTGSPWVFGYEVQWGAAHGLGFHDAPWGPPHTPARGLGLTNLYLIRLQQVLFESPVPGLLLPLLALGFTRGLRAGDRYLLTGSALLVALYFFYWHEGEYLGPRFLLPLAPVAVLWTARFPRAWGPALGSPDRALGRAAVIAVVVSGLAVGVPARWRQYGSAYEQRRVDVDGAVRRAGVENGIVLVPSGWSSQVTARVWALGVGRRETQWLTDRTDLCALELAVTRLEASGVSGTEAFEALRVLAADSLRVVPAGAAGDEGRRRLPGLKYPRRCSFKLQAEHSGTLPYPPFLLENGRRGNVFLRDQHERNERLLSRYAGRPLWVIRPVRRTGGGLDAVVSPLHVDSAVFTWHTLDADRPAR